MGVGAVHTSQLDALIAECDHLGGFACDESRTMLEDFELRFDTPVDVSLDPFSDAYFQQQAALYREIANRPLNQAEGELTHFDVDANVHGSNPYNSADLAFISRHARVIQTCLMIADLPPKAEVLDLGCGWGLSSEMMAFAGARVKAVDINPKFVELVRERAGRLCLPIDAAQSDFDSYTDDQQYDMVFFYECLHHSLRPWVTLSRVVRRVKPGGRLVWAGEPVNDRWWPHWGLRLDAEAVFAMRRHGWWESGWSEAFIAECFRRCGFALTMIPYIGLKGGPVGFAAREADAGRVRPDLSLLESFQAERQHYRDVIDRLHREDARMRASLSWKAAAPIRTIGDWCRRLLMRSRSRAC